MTDFLKAYGTEFQCEQALAAMRWPDGFVALDATGSVTPFSVTARAKSSSAQAVVTKLR